MPEIKWDVRPGTHFARCSCTDPPRKLDNNEVHVFFVSDGSGGIDNFGTAKCKECGTMIHWDTRPGR